MPYTQYTHSTRNEASRNYLIIREELRLVTDDLSRESNHTQYRLWGTLPWCTRGAPYLLSRAPAGEADHGALGEGRKRAPRPTRLRLPRGETRRVEVVAPGRVLLHQALRLLQEVLDRLERVDLAEACLEILHLSG